MIQNEPSFAMEVIGAIRGQNLTTIQNIRVRKFLRIVLLQFILMGTFRRYVMLKWDEVKKQSMLFIYLLINHPSIMIVVVSFQLWFVTEQEFTKKTSSLLFQLKHIQQAVDKSKNEDLKNRFEDLSKFVTQNNRLSTTDLVEFLNEPIAYVIFSFLNQY